MLANMVPQLPTAPPGVTAFRTPGGIIQLPPGANIVAYVRSSGFNPITDSPDIGLKLVSTLNAGLARCNAGRGDTVIVLPGHSESVSSATALSSLVTGSRIIGAGGYGAAWPTFTWTATAAQWAVSVADVHIEGLRLDLGGANGVVRAINFTGADCSLVGCDIVTATSAALDALIGVGVGTAAHRMLIALNNFRGNAAGNTTEAILVDAAVDSLKILGNYISSSATAATGPINVTAAATQLLIARNVISNLTAASNTALTIGNVAATGNIFENYFNTLDTGAFGAGDGISLGGASLVRCFQNFGANDPNVSGLLRPAVDT